MKQSKPPDWGDLAYKIERGRAKAEWVEAFWILAVLALAVIALFGAAIMF